jgi:energy-coupling factor transporter ATP-binding protein EcfA2
MITSLTLENFKSHRSTTVELGRLTVLVGPNGAGKTSVLQAIHCMSRLAQASAKDVFRGTKDPALLLRRGSGGPLAVQAQGTEAGRVWSTSFAMNFDEPDAAGARPWKIPNLRATTPSGDQPVGDRFHGDTWKYLASTAVLRFNPRQVAAPSYSDRERPQLESDGANTASVLAAIKLSDDERFEAITDTLRTLVPSVRRIKIRPARVPHRVETSSYRRCVGSRSVPRAYLTGLKQAIHRPRITDRSRK